jgi:hypothetical protein
MDIGICIHLWRSGRRIKRAAAEPKHWQGENMKILMIALSLVLFVVSAAARTESGLEADAFIVADKPNGDTLVLRITNRGETPQTIVTEHYSPGIAGMTGYGIIEISLSYENLNLGIAGQQEKLNTIRSLSKLAPITLRKGETVQISMPLDGSTVQELKKQDERPMAIRYCIGKQFSERFGLWHGTLEIKKSYRSMTSK